MRSRGSSRASRGQVRVAALSGRRTGPGGVRRPRHVSAPALPSRSGCAANLRRQRSLDPRRIRPGSRNRARPVPEGVPRTKRPLGIRGEGSLRPPAHPSVPHAQGRGADRTKPILRARPHGVLPRPPGATSSPRTKLAPWRAEKGPEVVEFRFCAARSGRLGSWTGNACRSELPIGRRSHVHSRPRIVRPPDADGSPRFTQVLRGYDPEQVRGYFLQLTARIDTSNGSWRTPSPSGTPPGADTRWPATTRTTSSPGAWPSS